MKPLSNTIRDGQPQAIIESLKAEAEYWTGDIRFIGPDKRKMAQVREYLERYARLVITHCNETVAAIEAGTADAAAVAMARAFYARELLRQVEVGPILNEGSAKAHGRMKGSGQQKRLEPIYQAVLELVRVNPTITANEAWGAFDDDVLYEIDGRQFNIFLDGDMLAQEELGDDQERVGDIQKIGFEAFRRNYLRPAKKEMGRS